MLCREVRELLRAASDLPVVISTGHTEGQEMRLLVDEAVWTEQTALTRLLEYQDWSDFADVLSLHPRVVYSSDFGQTSPMDIEPWQEWSGDSPPATALPEPVRGGRLAIKCMTGGARLGLRQGTPLPKWSRQ